MSKSKFFQTTEKWEKECIKTRRYFWLRKRRLQMFKISPKDKVLDLGCGDGLNIQILAQIGVDKIVGVDISGYLLKLAQINNPSIKFFLASAQKLPFKSNTFSIVLVDSVFHHLINYPKSIKEIKRVLKKGGRLVFSEPHKSSFRRLFDLITISSLAGYLPFFRHRKPAYLAERNIMNHWLRSEESFLKMLAGDGFRKEFLKVDLLSVIGRYQKI